jgi:hypothetical protein
VVVVGGLVCFVCGFLVYYGVGGRVACEGSDVSGEGLVVLCRLFVVDRSPSICGGMVGCWGW